MVNNVFPIIMHVHVYMSLKQGSGNAFSLRIQDAYGYFLLIHLYNMLVTVPSVDFRVC